MFPNVVQNPADMPASGAGSVHRSRFSSGIVLSEWDARYKQSCRRRLVLSLTWHSCTEWRAERELLDKKKHVCTSVWLPVCGHRALLRFKRVFLLCQSYVTLSAETHRSVAEKLGPRTLMTLIFVFLFLLLWKTLWSENIKIQTRPLLFSFLVWLCF